MGNQWEYVEIVMIYSILVCCPRIIFQHGLNFKGFRPCKYRIYLFHLMLLFNCRLSAKNIPDMPWLNTFGVDREYSNVTHPLPFLMWLKPTNANKGWKTPSVGGCWYMYIYTQYICFIYFLLFKVSLFCLMGEWCKAPLDLRNHQYRYRYSCSCCWRLKGFNEIIKNRNDTFEKVINDCWEYRLLKNDSVFAFPDYEGPVHRKISVIFAID